MYLPEIYTKINRLCNLLHFRLPLLCLQICIIHQGTPKLGLRLHSHHALFIINIYSLSLHIINKVVITKVKTKKDTIVKLHTEYFSLNNVSLCISNEAQHQFCERSGECVIRLGHPLCERNTRDREHRKTYKLWAVPIPTTAFRQNQNTRNGLDARARNLDRAHLRETIAIFKCRHLETH